MENMMCDTPEERIEEFIALIANQSDRLQNSYIVTIENLTMPCNDLQQAIEEFERRLEEQEE